MKFLFRAFVALLPWPLRRYVLQWAFGYDIHPTARIGWSWVFPQHLAMGPRARIGHLNVAIHLERIEMGSDALIDRSNWITGYPRGNSRHFTHCVQRDPVLRLGEHAAITKHHHLDCTDRIEIGAFTTIAGYRSQLLTHSIDLERNRQDCAPIVIGEYCFIGTAAVILGGAVLPPRSALGAKGLLNKALSEPDWLYAGVPAKAVKKLSGNCEYFRRNVGFVN